MCSRLSGTEKGCKLGLHLWLSFQNTWVKGKEVIMGMMVPDQQASLALTSLRGWHTPHLRLTLLTLYCRCSVTKSCPTLCNPMGCSTPGFSVLYHLLEFAQTHIHWVSDAIQPFNTFSMHEEHLENLIKQIAGLGVCDDAREKSGWLCRRSSDCTLDKTVPGELF